MSIYKLRKSFSMRLITSALRAGQIVESRKNGVSFFTLPYVKKMEESIAKNIVKHVTTPTALPPLSDEKLDAFITEYERQETEKLGFPFALHEEQRNAVHMAVNSQMCIITGGPGTGKTSVINAIRFVELHRQEKPPMILFTAPTGKAARRITESVGVPSKTVQKQIGANEYEDEPDAISPYMMICDEVSMLDTVIAYQLMRALDYDSKLILVGDVDQLSSVGFGSVLRDLIESRVVPCTKLEKTFRQGAETKLAGNIALLKAGFPGLEAGDDFKIITDFDESNMQHVLINAVLEAYSRYGVRDVILLTPYRQKGSTCANIMNRLLQDAVNPDGAQIETSVIDEDDDGNQYMLEIRLRVGDPVMQLKNRNDCPIANGDVGYIGAVYEDHSVYVDFDHYTKIYEEEELSELTLAYAMSVHKSQGSEYKCVVTCILDEHKLLLNRNMVYTAVTRSKKECVMFYRQDVLESALSIEGGYIRDTMLCEEIETAYKKYLLIKSA
jgi:exodeoxyribonuclease V alpha subunit